MPRSSAHSDSPGRLLAVLLILTGVGILIFDFSFAHGLLTQPVPGLNLPVKPGATPPPAANIGAALAAFVRQLLLLLVMTGVGSAITSRGIHLYAAAQSQSVAPSSDKTD